jgi:YggT family protein
MGGLLNTFIGFYEIALLIRVVLSWVPHNPYNQAIRFLYKITDPVLNPIRKLIPPFKGIDFSPAIVFLGLEFIVKQIIRGIF